MWKASKTGAIAAMLAVVPTFFAATAIAQNYGPDEDPPAYVARIGYTQGSVSYLQSGSNEWAEGLSNYPMSSGDRLYCDASSRAEIGAGSADVRLWQLTDVTLTNLTDQYEQLGLADGSIRVRIYSMNPGSTVEVDTPNGSGVITQPGDYRFDVFAQDGSSDVVVNSGALQITGPNGLNQEVDAGQSVQMTGINPIVLYPVNSPPFDTFDQWSIDRDHQVLNSQAAQYVSREMPGYADLDGAGSWAPTPDYGPVWYPQVNAGWRPYSVGHWAYVAPWGYTWIDDAPWGYAPFHYGRWAVIGGRWGWAPGPVAVVPVYSPALVAFVGGSGISIGIGFGGGGGVAAWFPLGIGEPFTPWYHASPAYARQVNVTNVNITNIHNTTIINNYNTYITNTRTVNNINQLNTNVTYANRAHVTAVPAAAMSGGRSVTQAAVKLTPQQQQTLATSPVHSAPSAPPPARPLLAARPNVKAPVAAPTLVTPRGLAKATPAANPARLAPVNLPKPTPAASLPKPVAGAVAGRPASAQPPAVKAATAKQARQPVASRPTAPAAKPPAPSAEKPAPTPAARPVAAAEKPNTKPAPAAKTAPKPAESPKSSMTPAHAATPSDHPAAAKPAAKPDGQAKPVQAKPATKPKPKSDETPPDKKETEPKQN
jgi:hypothetical protein